MKKALIAVVLAGLAALALLMVVAARSTASSGGGLGGYWSTSCVTGDDQFLVGGGEFGRLGGQARPALNPDAVAITDALPRTNERSAFHHHGFLKSSLFLAASSIVFSSKSFAPGT